MLVQQAQRGKRIPDYRSDIHQLLCASPNIQLGGMFGGAKLTPVDNPHVYLGAGLIYVCRRSLAEIGEVVEK